MRLLEFHIKIVMSMDSDILTDQRLEIDVHIENWQHPIESTMEYSSCKTHYVKSRNWFQ